MGAGGISQVFELSGVKTVSENGFCKRAFFLRQFFGILVVFCYKTDCFSGSVRSSEEGQVNWVSLDEMKEMKLASGMEHMLRLFLDDKISEHCFRMENGQWVGVLK